MCRDRLRLWLSPAALLLLAVVVAAALPRAGTAAPSHSQPIVEPQLLKELAAKDETSFIVHLREKADLSPARQVQEKLARRQAVVETLQTTAERSQQGLRTLLSELQATGHVDAMQPLWVVNAIVVTGDMEALKAMAERPEVERIRADHVRRLPDPPITTAAPAAPSTITWNLRFIAAPRVWNELDITGKGVVVANMDTGVDWTHPALRNGYRGGPEGQHNYNWYDATGAYPDAPDDGEGHGTHTMGIMVGYDPEANGGQHIGVAPGARWMAVKVFDDEGYTTDATLHQGFQWILAPTDLNGGNPDPALAPDVCNNSWGAANVADPTFWDDVAALRAADILPVFSGGNRGALGPGSVGTPSGFPHSFSVAATDANELLADFSSRGPSYWGETKPDVAAPGVSILSSLPNGRYDSISGTSMAAPHAAGTAALLLEADPTLTVDDLEAFMTRTAYDLGPAGPDNGFGAGQLDAFAAVSWALGAGKLAGQVTGADTELPLAAAQVEGISQNRGHTFRTASDERGVYAVAVPAGHYQVTATAFGYAPQTHDDVEVVDGYRSLRDFQLKPLPTGTVSGRALEVGGGLLGPVTIRAEGTPVETLTDRERSGYYDLELPPGTYTLVASSLGHRTERAVVEVVTGEVTTQDFWLATAPSVLLVDADGWLDDNISLYYQDALDQARYPYTTRRITDTAVIPTAEELAAYDIVIWVHPWNSPGYFELERHDTAVVDALTTYLLGGGRLLLAGQDLGYWDGNDAYYAQLLHSEYVQDEAFSDGVHGLEADTLEGVELDFAAIDAYKLLDAPDVIAPADEAAAPIAEYDLPGRAAALRVEDRGYRLVYLAFGLEGSGPRAARAQTLEQALAWLSQPTLKKQMEPAAVAPGGTLGVTLTLRNPLGTTRDVTLRDPLPPNTSYVEGSVTGGATYDEATNAVLWQGSLLPHETVTLAFATTVSDGLQGDTVIENTAWLELPDGPPIEARAATQVEAPNLVLSEKTVRPAEVTAHLPLVSGVGAGSGSVGAGLRPAPTANASRHRTMSEVRLVEPNDLLTYRVVLRNSSTVAAPAVTLLDPLPPQVSYVEGSVTGEAWYNAAEHRIEWSGPLPAAQPGRPEYLWSDSDAPAGPAFDWIDISDDGGTQVSLGDDQWAGPFPIDFSFPFYGQPFSEFYVSSNGWLSFSQPSSSESSNDPLPSSGAPNNLIAMFWDDLNPSTGGEVRYTADAGRLVVSFLDVPRYSSGGPYTFQAILTPDGCITLQYLTMLGSRLNESTVGIQNGHGSEGLQIAYNEHYVHDMLAVRVDPPQETSLAEHTVSFQVRVADDAPDNTPIVNEALIAASGVSYTRTATLVVQAADLTLSEKQVSSNAITPGDVLTYTITLNNNAEGAAQVTVTDPLPVGLSFVEGSITGGANYDPGRNEIGWQGQLGSGEQWLISFGARLDPELPAGSWVTNTATIDDGVHPPLVRTAVTRVEAPDLSHSRKVADRGWAVGGEVLTYTLELVNRGAVTATSVSLVDPLPPELTLLPDTLTGDATYDPGSGEVRWYGDLAPRAENFGWLDSDTPGGPIFDWLDISEIGTVVPLGDDQWAGPFDIGFVFPFFEEAFGEFYLSSNGWLSFSQPTDSDFSNEHLPSPSAPKNLIAMFWDDLNPSTSGDVWVHSDGRRLVVSYVNISRYGSGGPYTFQAILTANGNFTLQDQAMLGTRLNEATIGIQNADGGQGGSVGMTVAHNEQYVHDDLAVRFEPPARPHEVSFQARLAADLALDTVVTNTAFLTDAWGQTMVLSATVDVNQVDLSGSAVTLAPALVLPGARLTCTVTLHNDGNAADSVAAVLPVPEHTVFLPGSAAGGAVYEEDLDEVRGRGEVPPDGQASFSFAVVADRPLADGTIIRAGATIDDGAHPPFQREAAATVTAPDLSGSSKQAHADWVMVGQVLSYTVEVRNSGSMATEVHFRDPLPAGVNYVEGSAWAGSGSALSYDEVNHTLLWQGMVPPQTIAVLRFAVQPLGVTTAHNTATLADGLEVITEVSSSTEVFFPYAKLFLPIMHNYEW